MTSKVNEVVGHLPTLLPDGPEESPFTEANWNTLLAIMDTVIPSISREKKTSNSNQRPISETEYQATVDQLVVDPPNEKDLNDYFNERASDIPAFHELLKRMLAHYTPEDSRKGLGFILSSLKYILPISQTYSQRSQIPELTFIQQPGRIPHPHRLHNPLPRAAHPHPRRNPRAMAALLSPTTKPRLQTNDRIRQTCLAQDQSYLPKSHRVHASPAPCQAQVKSRVRFSAIFTGGRTRNDRNGCRNCRLWLWWSGLC